MRLQWVGQSAEARSTHAADLRLVNGYSEAIESKQGKTTVVIYGTPGLRRLTTLPGTGQVRGLFATANGRAFAVQGATLYELASDWSATSRGTLATVAGPVIFEENGIDVVLVDGANSYVFRLGTNVFVPITTPPTAAVTVNFLDNYLLFPIPGTQKFQWTDLLSTTIDSLSFTTIDGAPDLLISQMVARREIWNFGATSTEVWVDTGDLDNPFTRVQGAFLQQGCAAVQSPALVGETVCWLTANEQGQGLVVQAVGYTVNRISTHAVETAIQSYDVVSDALAWTQQQEGHLFYWLTFPSANATWVYDATSGLWHERGYLDPITGGIGRHRANCYAYLYGTHVVGDFEDGRLFALDPQTYSDDGAALALDMIPPPLFDPNGLHRVMQQRLQLDCKVGVGLDSAVTPGSNPQIWLRVSNDGGATWGPELFRSLGAIGKTRVRVYWDKLGSGYDRRNWLRITDPVERVIAGAVTDVKVLNV